VQKALPFFSSLPSSREREKKKEEGGKRQKEAYTSATKAAVRTSRLADTLSFLSPHEEEGGKKGEREKRKEGTLGCTEEQARQVKACCSPHFAWKGRKGGEKGKELY